MEIGRRESAIYLDHNATTPLDPRVLARMRPFLENHYGNPSSVDHAFGWEAAEAVEEARLEVASLVCAKPAEVVFTSGATESINLALKGVLCGTRSDRRHVLVSAVEHDAVLEVCRQLSRTIGVSWDRVAMGGGGNVDPGMWEAQIGETVRPLTSLMLANSETGSIYPVQEIAEITHRRPGGLSFSDVTQAVGKIAVDVHGLAVDLAALSAHKMYGPKGIGALIVRSVDPKIELEPLIAGGPQEGGRRGGTLNVSGIVGFGEACRIARLEMVEESARMRALRDGLEGEIVRQLPDSWINGADGHRIASTTNIGFPEIDARLLIRDIGALAVSTRSACSSGEPGPSHVLKALGLSDADARSCIRFSVGRFTTAADVDRAVERVVASVRKLRRAQHVGVR